MKCKETIDKIIKGEKTLQTAEELSEIMNESFKSVFTVEGTFIFGFNQLLWHPEGCIGPQ